MYNVDHAAGGMPFCRCGNNNATPFQLPRGCCWHMCPQLGPVRSAEECACIVGRKENDIERIVLPGQILCIPETVKRAEILLEGFQYKEVSLLDSGEETGNPNCRYITLGYLFEFDLALFDEEMRPYQILCMPPSEYPPNGGADKNRIRCSVSCELRTGLCHPPTGNTHAAWCRFSQRPDRCPDASGILVQTLACPMNAEIRCGKEFCHPPHDIYWEPSNVVFINLALHAKVCSIPLADRLIRTASMPCTGQCMCPAGMCRKDAGHPR